jgi:FeS assembly SUF system protein
MNTKHNRLQVDKLRVGESDAIPQVSELREQIVACIRTIYDPEISVNIYDLGLIYKLDINERSEVSIEMTLTSPACPVAGTLLGQVEQAVKSVQGVRDVRIQLVWDPPWSSDQLSDEAKLTMDLF